MDSQRKSLRRYEMEINNKNDSEESTYPIYWMLYVVKWSSFRFLILPVITLFMIIQSLGSSGDKKYGDFEAQRHWMEITLHLPIKEWYFHNAEWWGLDYPPLSAYLSYIYGKIGHFIEPKWFALDTSHGLQTQDLKFYMRMTVIVCDFIIYFPAVIRFVRYWRRLKGGNTLNSVHEKSILLPLMPATILLATPNRNTKAWVSWLNTFGTFSMWPLLKRDGLLLQYVALLIYWLWLGGFLFHPPGTLGSFETFIHMGSYVLLVLIHLLEALVPPPQRFPHLWVLANMALSFFCFVVFWFWSHWKLLCRSGLWLKHIPNPNPSRSKKNLNSGRLTRLS
ncbi:hypothetical protein PMAC_002499 [Pneumocystis sp. 'macacae']|nr:hypothetical protein PMAC_002499 [Pneumocystis sp. 'macacae']